VQLGVAQGPLDRHADPLDQRVAEQLELLARERPAERPAIHDDAHLVLVGLAQRALGDFGCPAQRAMDRARLRAGRDFRLVAHGGDEAVHDGIDEILAAEEIVAGRGPHFHHAFEHFQDRYVEGAAAEIEHQDLALALQRLEPIGEGCRGRLVEQPLDLEPGQFAGRLGRLALGVVEIGRHGDDRFGHRMAQMRLGIGFELAQHQSR
jgi:hypothetical protein